MGEKNGTLFNTLVVVGIFGLLIAFVRAMYPEATEAISTGVMDSITGVFDTL